MVTAKQLCAAPLVCVGLPCGYVVGLVAGILIAYLLQCGFTGLGS